MFTNVINGAFESTSTVAEGVILTETFFRLAKREAVKRCVDKKAAEIQHLFITQVMKTRSEFDTSRLNPPLRMQEPQFAGIFFDFPITLHRCLPLIRVIKSTRGRKTAYLLTISTYFINTPSHSTQP